MSHFYGAIQGNRGKATRCGTRGSGIHTVTASWNGAVGVRLWHDEETGQDMARVYLMRWGGRGTDRLLYEGPVDASPFPALEAITGADKDD